MRAALPQFPWACCPLLFRLVVILSSQFLRPPSSGDDRLPKQTPLHTLRPWLACRVPKVIWRCIDNVKRVLHAAPMLQSLLNQGHVGEEVLIGWHVRLRRKIVPNGLPYTETEIEPLLFIRQWHSTRPTQLLREQKLDMFRVQQAQAG